MAFNEIEQRKDELKEKLLKMGYFKHPDGRQLYELSLRELEKAYMKKNAENHARQVNGY